MNKRITIGFLTNGLYNPLSRKMLHGIRDVVTQHHANLICFAGEGVNTAVGFDASGNVLYDLVKPACVDGLVIYAGALVSELTPAEKRQFWKRFHPLPIVMLEESAEGFPCVTPDFAGNLYTVISHLIEVHHHRRIAFIRGPQLHSVSELFYQGYCNALRDHGIPLNPQIIYQAQNLTQSEGVRAIETLIDERKLSLDAIAGSNDNLAMGAMAALHARGIRVPEDIAVTGHDDTVAGHDSMGKSSALLCPLTTIPNPAFEMAQQATEVLLAQIARQVVPDNVVVPARMIVRQSCGCIDRHLVGVVLDPQRAVRLDGQEPQIIQRNNLLKFIVQEIHLPGIQTEQIGQLLDALLAELEGATSGKFLSTLNVFLHQMLASSLDVMDCHDLISAMRQHLLPMLCGAENVIHAENLWQQARIMIGNMAQRFQIYQMTLAEEQAKLLRELGQTLITTFHLEELMAILAQELPRLGIPSGFVALYEDPKTPDDWARLIMGYTEKGRLSLEDGGRRFLATQLVPEGMLPQGRTYSLVVEPLFFEEQQIGLAIFEIDPKTVERHDDMYETLRVEISSALQGALLVNNLARKDYILDTFMENVPDSIYFKDRKSRFIRVNQSLADLFGVDDPSMLVGKSDFDFFPEKQAAPKYEQEQAIIRTGQPLLAQEEPDAGGRWALTTKMPLRDEHGAIIGTFGISRDITELKQAQLEVAAAYEEIKLLNHQLQEENLRMSAELDVSRRIQQMVLPPPEELRQIEGLEIVGYMQPADEVGGDYYDVLRSNGTIHIGIGDVTGHGLESGILMLMTQTAIRTLIERGETNPVLFLAVLNRVLKKNIDRMHIDRTLTLAFVNYDQRHLKIVGQHEELLVIRTGGRIERVDTINLGFPLGLEDAIDDFIAEATVTLLPGEGVALYTDGITEAANAMEEMYGIERLCDVISLHWEQSAEAIKQAVIADVTRHIGTQKVYDDVTLVVLKQK